MSIRVTQWPKSLCRGQNASISLTYDDAGEFAVRRNGNSDGGLALSMDFPRTGVSDVTVKKSGEWDVLSYQASEHAKREG